MDFHWQIDDLIRSNLTTVILEKGFRVERKKKSNPEDDIRR